uniref:PD-(D/E)XK endonuclease-like domain-containing protein n=1 Tax=viral metagenome TaxID=1070528 RepID=A0A6H2A1A9_9ZZZZ
MLSRSEVAAAVESAVTEHQKKKDEAATNGKLVHAWAEAHARGVMLGEPRPPVGDDLPDQVVQGINAFLDWIEESKVKFLATERMVYSKEHGYYGFADKVIEIGGKRYLGDYKTSGGIYPEMYFQVAAYRKAWEEEMGPLDGHMIIRFGKDDGKFEVTTIDSYEEDFQAFLACKRLRESVTRLGAR